MSETPKKTSKLVSALLSRQPGGTKASPGAHRQPDLPEGWPETLPFRKRPKPYSRAIAWTPKDDAGPARSGESRIDRHRDYELFVSQRVFGEMRHHLLTSSTAEPFGFLLGKVIFCPWTEAPYIVIDALRRETQNLPSSSEVDRFRHAWIGATRDARHRRSQVIGWYHKHGVLGLRLSEWDLKLQEEFFPEPWQCALIITSAAGPAGGFIQRSHRARLFRKGLAPFYELVDLDARLVEHVRPTLVDWRNYEPDQQVHVIEAPWSEPERVSASIGRETPKTVGTLRLRGRKWNRDEPHERTDDEPILRLADVGPPEPPAAGDFDEEEFRQALPRREEAIETTEAPAAARAPTRERLEVDTPESVPPAPPRRTAAAGREEGPRSGNEPDDPRPDRGAAAEKTSAPAEAQHPPFEERPFDLEPSEIDPTRSEEWLVSLVSEVLAIREELRATRESETGGDREAANGARPAAAKKSRKSKGRKVAPVDETPAEPAAESTPESEAAISEEEAPEAAEATTLAEEEAPEPVEATALEVGAPEPSKPALAEPEAREPAPATAGPPAPERPADAIRPPAAAARQDERAATTGTPGINRMGPIPVVLVDDLPWRPSRKLIRWTMTGVVIVATAVAGFMLADGPEPATPGSFSQVTPPAAQPPEFARLVSEFRTQLRDYRVNLLGFQEGELGCEPLAASFGVLRQGRERVLSYSESAPGLAGRFEILDVDFEGARDRFVSTGCEMPPDPDPSDPDGSRVVGSGGATLVPPAVPTTR